MSIENTADKQSSFNGQEKTELVLVALHQDLYNADIIIHETDVEPAEFDIAVRIGCEFPKQTVRKLVLSAAVRTRRFCLENGIDVR